MAANAPYLAAQARRRRELITPEGLSLPLTVAGRGARAGAPGDALGTIFVGGEFGEFAEIGDFIDTEVKFYSSGMYLRLAFAVAIHTNPDVFLVDEILAVGDEPFQRKCITRIKELVAAGKTLVVVSHDLNLVADICERGVVMERGRKVFDGPCPEAVAFLRERQ